MFLYHSSACSVINAHRNQNSISFRCKTYCIVLGNMVVCVDRLRNQTANGARLIRCSGNSWIRAYIPTSRFENTPSASHKHRLWIFFIKYNSVLVRMYPQRIVEEVTTTVLMAHFFPFTRCISISDTAPFPKGVPQHNTCASLAGGTPNVLS